MVLATLWLNPSSLDAALWYISLAEGKLKSYSIVSS